MEGSTELRSELTNIPFLSGLNERLLLKWLVSMNEPPLQPLASPALMNEWPVTMHALTNTVTNHPKTQDPPCVRNITEPVTD